MQERLQKILASNGIASRRECEKIILKNRVSVNGKIVNKLGSKADIEKDIIKVDNKQITKYGVQKKVLMFNKPKNVITSMADDCDRRDISCFINISSFENLTHVGRLDYDSEGLLFLANDGEFANLIMHPKYEVEKVYEVTLDKMLREKDVNILVKQGVELKDGVSKFDEILSIIPLENNGCIVNVKIHSGKNRIVRRTFKALNYDVKRLVRTEIAGVKLQKLQPGKYKELSKKHVEEIKNKIKNNSSKNKSRK